MERGARALVEWALLARRIRHAHVPAQPDRGGVRDPRGRSRGLVQSRDREPRLMFSTLAPLALPASVPFARQLELAAAHRFDALDLPVSVLRRPARDGAVEQIEELFARHGLRCGGWRLPFDYQAPRSDFNADV